MKAGEAKDFLPDLKTIIPIAYKKEEMLNFGAEAQVGLAPRVAALRKMSVIELNQDQDLVHQEVDMDQ